MTESITERVDSNNNRSEKAKLASMASEFFANKMLFEQMRAAWQNYHVTRRLDYLQDATKLAAEIEDRVLEKIGAHGSTTPIGVFTSKESGLMAITSSEVLDRILALDPKASFYGYINLPRPSAMTAAAGFQYMTELQNAARERIGTEHPSLDTILRNPIPIPSTVVGPLEISNKRFALFLEYIIGPLEHDFLDPDFPTGDITEEQRRKVEHIIMLGTAHHIGTWQGNPFPDDWERPIGVEENVRNHYIIMGSQSVNDLADLLNLKINEEALGQVHEHFIDLVSNPSFRLNPHPVEGNITVKGDWNLRNVALNIVARKAKPSVADVWNSVLSGGEMDYVEALKIITKLDMNNPTRTWVVDDDDIAHLVRNVNAPQEQERIDTYSAAAKLVRLAWRHYRKYEEGHPESRDAVIKFADYHQELIKGAAPSEILPVRARFAKYAATTAVVHWLRVLRQASLAPNQYLAKAVTFPEMTGLPRSERDIESIQNEAEEYIQRAIDLHDEAISAIGLRPSAESYDRAKLAHNTLLEIQDGINGKKYDPAKLRERGENFLISFGKH